MRILTHRKTAKKRSVTRHAINRERVPVHVSKGDTVRVMRGEDKGKEGKVMRVFTKTGRVMIDGVNIVKRHRKARRPEEESAIIEQPAPIHASNVMLVDPQSGKATRYRIRLDEDGSKERVSVKSGEPIPRGVSR